MSVPRNGPKGELADMYGMTVVACSDPIMLPYTLNIGVPPRRRGSPLSWRPSELMELSDRFQPRLVDYRLREYENVAASTWDVPAFISPAREIARSLGMCLPSEEMRKQLVDVLTGADAEAKAELGISDSSIAIEALLTACHDVSKDSIFVGAVARIVNRIFEGRGEETRVTDRRAGSLLKGLGLKTERLGKAGRGFRLREGMRERIHRLALAYRVPSIEGGLQRCRHCEMFDEQ
jgi:hypothetical protein